MIFLSLILAHLLGDFYFQTDKMVKDKPKYLKRHLVHHSILTFSTLVLMYLFSDTLDNFILQVLCSTIVIILFHYIIDKLKIKLTEKIKKVSNQPLLDFNFFIIDQLLHIGSLLLVCCTFLKMDLSYNLDRLFLVLQLVKGNNPNISSINILLFLVIMFIISTTVSGHLIRLLLGIVPKHLALFEGKYVLKDIHNDIEHLNNNKKPSITEEFSYMVTKKQDLSRGAIIGYLERLLVIVLIVNGAFTSIAFIVAAKSLARFKQMDDRDFSEYFLLGTLSSILLGILYGIITKLVLII
ncbi:MAG: DUF3307 domain-containing protein [Bacillota bacterium]